MNISASTPAHLELSPESIAYIVKNSQSGSNAEENIKSAIALAVEQVNNKLNARKSVEESVVSSLAAHNELKQRISFAREVGRNTLRKMTHGHPKSLDWLKSGGDISVIGVYRKQMSFRQNEYTKITSSIISGSTQFGSLDVVRFSVGNGHVAELPLELLREDPMLIAQMVRKECRLHAEKEFNAQNQNLSKRLADLKREYEASLAKLEKEKEKAVTKPIKPSFKAKPKRPRKPATV